MVAAGSVTFEKIARSRVIPVGEGSSELGECAGGRRGGQKGTQRTPDQALTAQAAALSKSQRLSGYCSLEGCFNLFTNRSRSQIRCRT
jgi:predicted RNA-binding Zn ribbon-like protein